jgi:hypothetical protein
MKKEIEKESSTVRSLNFQKQSSKTYTLGIDLVLSNICFDFFTTPACRKKINIQYSTYPSDELTRAQMKY